MLVIGAEVDRLELLALLTVIATGFGEGIEPGARKSTWAALPLL